MLIKTVLPDLLLGLTVHAAGAVVVVADSVARRLIERGHAVPFVAEAVAPPAVETAELPPAPESAVAAPARKRKG